MIIVNGQKIEKDRFPDDTLRLLNLPQSQSLTTTILWKYEKDEDIKVVLANFEMLHQKYAQEVDNKRTFSITLQNIKDDIERMQSIHTKKLEEITKVNQQLRNENSNLKIEIEKMRYNNPLTNSSKINRKVNKSGSSSNNQSHRSSTDKFPEITTNRRSMNLDNKDKSNKSIKSLV